ncbi:polysaccharide biosynthesis tyrosine autokinase [Flavobacterium sp. SM15]|uniref:GumC family protein n=1 Tax=Flavobacterium sp. SM15 TaxID=2908005 RepID=UPI001ED9F219|nr:tyrosine-protein kinase [Flavobacterium sp. SM15]MCG2611272.1 polysaccharide biosynthesis tyrosine autokinase [Flavobacterium sp. SM15]
MESEITQSTNKFSSGNSIEAQINYYLSNWKWFVLGVIVFVSGAYVYLRYSIPQYSASTTLMIKDEKKGGVATEQSAFSDLAVLSGVKSNLDNEIEVIKSLTMIKETVRVLGLNVSYFNEGRVKSEELYKKSPVQFNVLNIKEGFEQRTLIYKVISSGANQFELFDRSDVKLGTFQYGQTLQLKEGTAVLFETDKANTFKENPFKVMVQMRPISSVAGKFKGKLNVKKVGDRTTIVELSLIDPVKEKAEDFLNGLIRVYNQDVVADKNLVFENTSKFINDRLKIIEDELEGVEKSAEAFKIRNHVTDITSESSLYLSSASDFERKEIETETKLKVVDVMEEYLKKISKDDLIPANILTTDASASGLIEQYNKLVLERNRMLKNAGPQNAVILTLNKKIDALRLDIDEVLAKLRVQLEVMRKDVAYQKAVFNGKISKIPTLEREARALGRQQQIKEALYLYLLQKREETAISLAVTSPNAKVVDPAIALGSPVSPQRGSIYMMSLAAGLLVPFGVLYLLSMLDNKVKGRADIESKLSIPILGDVPHSDSNDEIISSSSRSASAEAIRIVRTNLEFLFNQVPEGQAKTIFVTSTIPKEGKTFIAVNLAGTIALSGKKVLVVGMDIRNPKLENYLDLNPVGVTNYLSTNDLELSDLIQKQPGFEAFYAFPSGVIPPNPAELLMNKKVNLLFEKLKKEFDYIVVDTAPVSLVTDTLLIAHHAHSFVYVTRANYLDKRMLHVPDLLYREKKLPNMAILINDTDIKKGYGYGYGGYGYGGYGYGYGVEAQNKKWYSAILDKFKKEA